MLFVTFTKVYSEFSKEFKKGKMAFYLTEDTFYFLAFHKLVNKNFNQVIFLFKQIIANTFFGKSISLFGKVSPNICKSSFCNSPKFFPVKLSSLIVCKMFLGSRMQKDIHNLAKHVRWSFLWK